jgi:putative transposase
MLKRRAYKYRFYPTDQQKQVLACTFGCGRFVYNHMLKLRTDGWHNGQRISYVDTSKELTRLKKLPEYAWLNEVSSVPVQQALRHLQQAFMNFFEHRTAYPKFKKKFAHQSATFMDNAYKWDRATRQLTLSKIGRLNIRWSRKFEGKPTSITISKDPSDRYFVSFAVDELIQPLPKINREVGVDLGLHHFMVTSDGTVVENPRHLRKHETRLRMLQQRLSRRTPKGQNWLKTKYQIAKLHAKIADSRLDFQHKTTTWLVQNYQTIYMESLAVKNLLKNHCLAKSISDVGWGTTINQVAYKADWYGRKLVQIDRFFPSSKRCHVCGHIFEELDLSMRSWMCPACSIVHDRDANAAQNILAVGRTATIYGQGQRNPKHCATEPPHLRNNS